MKSVLFLTLALVVGGPVVAPGGAQTPCPLLAGIDVAHYLGGPATFGSSRLNGRICAARRDEAIIKAQVQDDTAVVATDASAKLPFH
jgi:hypothetical protein